MPFFRSAHDRQFIKNLNRELIQNVIGEKVLYFAISKKNTETNLYGESESDKIFDSPLEVYGLVKWKEQEIKTTEFGQDVIYNLDVHVLEDMLNEINLGPIEGDIIEYSGHKFEIQSIQNSELLFGKAFDNFALKLICKTVRESTFKSPMSATVDLHKRTRPDNVLTSSFSYSEPFLPFSGTIENL